MIARLIHKFWHILRRISFFLRFRFPLTAWGAGLQVGKRCRIDVPVSRRYSHGELRIGDDCQFGVILVGMLGDGTILLQPRERGSEIVIGNGCIFSNNVSLVAMKSIRIGDRCLFGEQVCIIDSDFHGLAPDCRRTPGKSRPVRLGNNVWIGNRSMILKGVSIGDNAVIAAMSVVTRDIPANTVAAGNPARVIREL